MGSAGMGMGWARWARSGGIAAGIAVLAGGVGLDGPAGAEPADDGGALPLASPVPTEEGLYGKVVDEGGRADARNRRRRDGEYVAWELPQGTVVRYQHLVGGRVAEDHLYDADGYPFVTVFFTPAGAPDRAVVPAGAPIDVALAGWAQREVPGGKLFLPEATSPRQGGGVAAKALGGEVEVWIDTVDLDPFSDAFRDGLVSGCGCQVVDRATTWVDGRAGVRYRLLVPGAWPRDAVDLWAVPLGAGKPGEGAPVWLMSFRMPAPADPVAALLPGRALAALTALTGAP